MTGSRFGRAALVAALLAAVLAAPAWAQDAVPAAPPVRVAGTVPPWVREGVTWRQMGAPQALGELYAGRADVALVALPGPPPPASVAPVVWVPAGMFAVQVAYRLPGIDLRLDVRTACALMGGDVRTWDDPRVAAHNPGVRLPRLPVVSTVRTQPGGAARAFAAACVQGGFWPAARLKSAWSAGAVLVRGDRRAQLADLRLTGSVGVVGPHEVRRGQQVARLLAPSGRYARPTASLGLVQGAPLPSGPQEGLPAVTEGDAYPLRGLVWAAVVSEQRYRGRPPELARAVTELVRALQGTHGADFAALPAWARPALNLRYGGSPLDVHGPPQPPAPPLD